MTLAYVTARFPCGSGEQFFGPEIDALVSAGLEVAVVPLRQRTSCLPGPWVLWATPLLSWAAVTAFAGTLVRQPRALVAVAARAVRTSPRNALLNLVALPKACWLAERVRRAGVTHIHAQWGTVTATVAMAASTMTHVPWSFTVHRYDILEDNLLATKMHDAAFVRCISDSARSDCRRVVGDLPASTFVSHLGVVVPPQPASPCSGTPVILCPAQLEPRKGQDVLLRALASINDRPWHLWLAGQGESRGALEALAGQLGIDERVSFLGLVPHHELLELYGGGRVALVALASEHEGIPVSLMEAMAAGVPVVSTSVGGIPELLRDGAGRMVAPHDPQAIAEALRAVLDDPEEWLRLSRSGRQRVLDEFELDQTVRALAAAIGDGS